ncbi:abortive infection system antitoxin AbiGi family protein [uncultured Tenacibaculum sp.]|uniref:abortive infection system antitoxin AbiGi family protein n=1 Tax=uncultured Tenacibaculum sp. TaxID=174713 RepID=UPI002611534E|nr:abortive infection system antitoxin AbiGi family protein [uncultured Tenacibaculum sp.]
MGLSPSTLFHFTSKQGLKGILRDNFKVKYCLEEIDNDEKPVEIAIPMVSFCDIKISEITEHIEKYGYYGIGLSKEWAFEKNLNPVIYMNSKSSLCSNILSSIRKIRTVKEVELSDYLNLSNLVRYTKIYEGKLTRKGETIDNYRFADEREWRYVPEIENTTNPKFMPWLGRDLYDTDSKKRTANKKLNDERLYFNANQILYIIVKKESEINDIINHIRTVKGVNYTMGEVDRLMTRILSCERILNDF